MASVNNPKARETELVIQELKDEVLIYDLRINKAFCLNETSALVFRLCDGNNSITEIGEKLSKQLKQKVTEDFVRLALDGFKKKNLLENGNELTNFFAGMSRRDVIKTVGFSTVVVLPVIFSLVAPTAAMAQSAGKCGCVAPGDCLSQTGCPSTVNCNPSGVCAP